ncbi:MAG TPA: hypothetical protein VJK52_06315 [Candidatus Nanoarchaeia archaeon]|nr:hypothetical protein [Candidatus Nanoarchaeia archaeon]
MYRRKSATYTALALAAAAMLNCDSGPSKTELELRRQLEQSRTQNQQLTKEMREAELTACRQARANDAIVLRVITDYVEQTKLTQFSNETLSPFSLSNAIDEARNKVPYANAVSEDIFEYVSGHQAYIRVTELGRELENTDLELRESLTNVGRMDNALANQSRALQRCEAAAKPTSPSASALEDCFRKEGIDREKTKTQTEFYEVRHDQYAQKLWTIRAGIRAKKPEFSKAASELDALESEVLLRDAEVESLTNRLRRCDTASIEYCRMDAVRRQFKKLTEDLDDAQETVLNVVEDGNRQDLKTAARQLRGEEDPLQQ